MGLEMVDQDVTKSRRAFLKKGLGTLGLLGGGGAVGWWIGKQVSPNGESAPVTLRTDAPPAYDLEPFMKYDAKYALYREISGFSTDMTSVSRIGIAPEGLIWVVGGQEARAFSGEGELVRSVALAGDATSLAFSPDGEVCLALTDRIVGLGSDGETRFDTGSIGRDSIITGLAVTHDELFLADAGRRLVVVCDRQGQVTRQWGKKNDDHPGFVIPSPYFSLRLDGRGQVFVSNTGRLRIETYLIDGTYQTSWGTPGMTVDTFCGCCNPVYFDVLSNGDLVTSEKGLVRIHRYREDGTFVGVVAGPEDLWHGVGAETKLGGRGKMGDPFDVAIDGEDRVWVLDPHRRSVRVFALKGDGEGGEEVGLP